MVTLPAFTVWSFLYSGEKGLVMIAENFAVGCNDFTCSVAAW